MIRCHALGRSHGLPIAADVFHLLFVSLDNARRSEEGLAFAQRSLDDAVDDASNAGLALQPLLLGLLDSLARHPRPRSARVAAQHLRSSLQPIVSTACGGCAVWGDESQSWVVDGGCRVAVIDAVALAYPRVFDVLLESYDAVMIPFTAVRAMLRRLETEPPNSPGATSVLTALDALMQAQLKPPPMVSARGGRGPPQQAGAGPVQVMPFIHHLSALELIAPDTTDATVGTRSVAESDAGALRSLLDAASAAGRGDGAGGVLPAPRYCVLPGAASLEEHSALRGEGSVAPPGGSGSGFFSAQPPIVASSSQKRQQPRKGDAKPRASQPSPTITANSHAAAVALLLKRLNPDADVTVLCGHHGLPYCKAAGVECISFRDFIYSRRGRTGAHGKLPSDADAARRLVSGGGSLSLAPSASVPSDAALASREDASRSSSLALAATSPASATPASSRRAVVADFSDYQLDDEDDAATTPAMREAERTARTMPS